MSRFTEEEEEAEYYYEHNPSAVRPRAQRQYAKPIGPAQQPHYGANRNQYAGPIGPAQQPHYGVNPNQYNAGPGIVGPANPRGGVNPNQYASPAGPARVNPNQYASPAGPTNPHAGVNANQYAQPAGPNRSAMDRVVQAAKNAGRQVQNFDQGPTGQAIRQHAQRINAQGSGGRVQGYARFSNDQPSAEPVHPSSVMHPGHKLYVIEGSIIMSSGGQKTPEEKAARRRGRGGLGGANPGFGNDNGL